jgi:hypothetical protein
MPNHTFKGLVGGAAYKLFLEEKARPWVQRREAVPGAPISSGVAAADGSLTLNLTTGLSYSLQGPDGNAKQALVSTTKFPPL